MNTNSIFNNQFNPPISQPDQDDPDMEYVQALSTDEFTQRVEEQESDRDLERRTEYNMNLLSQFLEHLKQEAGIDVPEEHLLSFFDA